MVVGVPVLPAVEKLRQELQKALLLGAVQGLHELLALPAALLLAQAALIAALLGGTDKELAAVAGLPLPGDEALVLQLLDDLAQRSLLYLHQVLQLTLGQLSLLVEDAQRPELTAPAVAPVVVEVASAAAQEAQDGQSLFCLIQMYHSFD